MQKHTKEMTNKKDNKVTKKSVASNSSKSTVSKKTAVSKKATKTASLKNVEKTPTKPKNTKSTTKTKTQKSSPTKRKTTPKVAKNKTPKGISVTEYYDLPYRYNETTVKILAQTPNTFFVYWDISDIDRKKYTDQFGDKFFENTIPILIVHNKAMNYSFEIEINDFANSWYFTVNDAKCDYEIELGRRSKHSDINFQNNYLYIASSNTIEAPNNHILFEKNQKTLFYRNIKTNTGYKKEISQLEFMSYAGRIYNIYDIYKKIYKNEELQNIEKNPGSKF